jgi:hypothetical protein
MNNRASASMGGRRLWANSSQGRKDVRGAFWNYRHSERGNPKSETRSPKQTPSTKQGMTKTTTLLAVLSLGPLGI